MSESPIEIAPRRSAPPARGGRRNADPRRRASATRSSRRLLAAANASDKLKARWHGQQVTAERLGMSDHSWVHLQIVLNSALRIFRLLHRAGLKSAIEPDYAMSPHDAEVVIAGALPAARPRHVDPPRRPRDVQPVPRRRHPRRPARGRLRGARADRSSPPRSCTRSSATARAGARSRSRPAWCAWPTRSTWSTAARASRSRRRLPNIHSLSAAAIDEVRIVPGRGAHGPRRDPDEQLGRRLPGRRAARPPSCAARASSPTSRSSPGSTPSTRSGCSASTRSSRSSLREWSS